jgi:hypothetical protein
MDDAEASEHRRSSNGLGLLRGVISHPFPLRAEAANAGDKGGNLSASVCD